jgi:calcium release-activated calcium channel protein 1
MVALVELQYDENTPHLLLVTLGIVTTLLVSVHLIALMMSTCLLPHIEANGCTQDSPHNRLHFYIELSWLFSTCIGLLLFLLEIGVIFFVKFDAVNFILGAYITTAILVPVFIIFVVISCLIHRERFSHTVDRVGTKVDDFENIIDDNPIMPKQMSNVGIIQQV